MDGTTWVYLDASKKIVYLRYRRFLKTNDKYHSKIYFRYYNNKPENEPPPERRKNRQHVFKMVKNMRVILRKKNSDGMKKDRSTPLVVGVPFKK